MSKNDLFAFIARGGATLREVVNRFGISPDNATSRLHYYYSDGRLERCGKPYRYYLPGQVPSSAEDIPEPLETPTYCHPDVQRRIMHRLRDMRGRDVTLAMLKHYVRAESAAQLHDAAEDLVAQGALRRGEQGLSWRYW